MERADMSTLIDSQSWTLTGNSKMISMKERGFWLIRMEISAKECLKIHFSTDLASQRPKHFR